MKRFALLGLMALALVTSAPAEEETPAPEAAATKAAPALTDAERASLLYMREEEKLARDLYTTLADAHDLSVFRTIAAAEQRHMDAVGALLRRFEIEDAAGKNPVGSYSDEALATLFAKLIAQGKKSPIEALAAGAHVEDRDIHDLNTGLAATKNPQIRAVYTNLVRASRNHLRAFTSRLTAEGVTYVPQHLAQEEYDAIVTSDHEPGHGGRAGFRGGRGRGAGQGRGCATGAGQGRGAGRGCATGAGQGRGAGRGCATGAGQGRGAGRGCATGAGRGRGTGRGCDGEAISGRGRGRSECDRAGTGRGRGRGRGAGVRGAGCDRVGCDACRKDDARDEADTGCDGAGAGCDGAGGRGAGRGRGRGRR